MDMWHSHCPSAASSPFSQCNWFWWKTIGNFAIIVHILIFVACIWWGMTFLQCVYKIWKAPYPSHLYIDLLGISYSLRAISDGTRDCCQEKWTRAVIGWRSGWPFSTRGAGCHTHHWRSHTSLDYTTWLLCCGSVTAVQRAAVYRSHLTKLQTRV